MDKLLAALFAWCALAWPGWSAAQPLDPAAIQASTSHAPDLKFPAEAKEPSIFSRSGNTILKPQGAGPFPAIVIHHTCGGLRSEIWDWADRAVERGYVAFVLDSLGPRGLKTNCFPPSPVTTARGVKDALQAAAHLQKIPIVDPTRIGHIGFSWGAMVGVLASSPQAHSIIAPGPRFDAVVAFYPMCYFPGTKALPTTFEFLRQDTDRPLLVLMGEADNETPPADCVGRLESIKAKNAALEWHLYPGATHCWDCDSLNGFRKTDFQGKQVVYRYDRQVTADSVERTFGFFDRTLKKVSGR